MKFKKNKHTFYVNNISNILPVLANFPLFPVSEQNSLCSPCLEKVRIKFPVFPVPWPPCSTRNRVQYTHVCAFREIEISDVAWNICACVCVSVGGGYYLEERHSELQTPGVRP